MTIADNSGRIVASSGGEPDRSAEEKVSVWPHP
jgi:hypothetical protein